MVFVLLFLIPVILFGLLDSIIHYHVDYVKSNVWKTKNTFESPTGTPSKSPSIDCSLITEHEQCRSSGCAWQHNSQTYTGDKFTLKIQFRNYA